MNNLPIESERLLDAVGWQILCELQADARLSYAEIGRRVGLSAPAVMERVHRLEEAGIITGYHAQVDTSQLGLPVTAIIRVKTPATRYATLGELVDNNMHVLECHHVTGDDCMVIKVVAESLVHLEGIIAEFGQYGQTTTSIVLSSVLTRRLIDRR